MALPKVTRMSLPSCIHMPALIRMTTHLHGITRKVNPVPSAPSVPAVMTVRVVRATVAHVLSASLALIAAHVQNVNLVVIAQNANLVATAQSVATVAHAAKEIVVRAVADVVVRKRRSAPPFRISRPSHHHPHRPCRKVLFQKPLRPSA